jgi:hypothetical protein
MGMTDNPRVRELERENEWLREQLKRMEAQQPAAVDAKLSAALKKLDQLRALLVEDK